MSMDSLLSSRRPGAVWGVLAIVLAVAVGCPPDRETQIENEAGPPFDPAASYARIAARQNERVGRIKSFWANATVELSWLDDEGEHHSENGHGQLIFDERGRTALTFTKLGEVYLWFGCDETRFWMFEGGDARRAYLARNENAFSACSEPLPIAVHPAELVDLLGMFLLPEGGAGALARSDPPVGIEWSGEFVIVTLASRWSNRRVFFDPDDALPKRVELIDPATGRIVATSALSMYTNMEVRELPPGLLPDVPMRVVINDSAGTSTMRLTMRSPRDRPPGSDPINPGVFDFNAVALSMRTRTRIILDRNCPEPAVAANLDQ